MGSDVQGMRGELPLRVGADFQAGASWPGQLLWPGNKGGPNAAGTAWSLGTSTADAQDSCELVTTLVDLLIRSWRVMVSAGKACDVHRRSAVVEDGLNLVRKQQPHQCRPLQMSVPQHAVHEAC